MTVIHSGRLPRIVAQTAAVVDSFKVFDPHAEAACWKAKEVGECVSRTGDSAVAKPVNIKRGDIVCLTPAVFCVSSITHIESVARRLLRVNPYPERPVSQRYYYAN